MSLNRRKFLTLTAMTGTAAMLSDVDSLAKPISTAKPQPGFQLMMFATNWGYGGTWEEFCSRIKQLGYDGAEIWWPGEVDQRNAMLDAFKKYDLKLGLLFGSGESDPKKNLDIFKGVIESAAALKPVYINCHTGRDYFTLEQNKPFVDFTTALSKSSGIPIYHETHRGRMLYSAPVSAQYMNALPDLKLTLDISHWCCVHESLLEDQTATVDLALSRTEHIHTRVGHAEGPQVNDPRAPEWTYALERHIGWWDKVVERKKKEGKLMTMLTEFGPIDYMPALPYTRQPVADQWDINVHMMKTLRSRYTS